MHSGHSGAARLRIGILGGAILLVSLATQAGCKFMAGSAGAGEQTLTVLDPRGQPSGRFGRRGEAGAHMMAIFDPETKPVMARDELIPLRMAPRLDSLDGKTIYLVDTGFEGGKAFLEEMQAWFRQNMPAVRTVVHIKSGNAFSDSPELWVELKKKADGVVFGVGG